MGRRNALIVVMVVVGVLAATASATPKLTSCGHVDKYVAVAAHRVSCNQARSIARSYLSGHHHPQRFSCRRHAVNAAAGWWEQCSRGGRFVNIVPE